MFAWIKKLWVRWRLRGALEDQVILHAQITRAEAMLKPMRSRRAQRAGKKYRQLADGSAGRFALP